MSMSTSSRLAVLVLTVLAIGIAAGGLEPARGERGARVGQPAPEITGGPWIGSPALTLARLRGRVVLVEFWTHG
jgi:hypothetical protein